MGRKSGAIILSITSAGAFILGCGHRETPQAVEETTVEEDIIEEKPEVVAGIKKIFYITSDGSEILSKDILLESDDYDESIIYDNLLELNVINSDIKIQNIKVVYTEKGKDLYIDFNKNFLDYLNGLTKAKEFGITTAIANSYLDYYKANNIYFLINDKALKTNNYDYTNARITYLDTKNPEYGKFETENNDKIRSSYVKASELFELTYDGASNIIISPSNFDESILILNEAANDDGDKDFNNYLEIKDKVSDKIKIINSNDSFITKNIMLYHQSKFDEMKVQTSFSDVMKEHNLVMNTLDFTVDDIDYQANKIVNSFCENGDKPTILENINKNDDMYLVGISDFKLGWMNGFDSKENITFYNLDGTQKEVPMLTSKENLNYFKDDNIEGFIRDYNDTYSFIGIMPKNNAVKLTDIDFDELLNEYNLKKKTLRIGIPEVNLSTRSILTETSKKLKINDIYTENNNNFAMMFETPQEMQLNGIVQYNTLQICSGAAQKVQEELSSDVTELIFDKPFVFMIYNKEANEVVFVGKINQL